MIGILSILFWFVCAPFMWGAAILGLVAVPLSMLGDGRLRTPKMWWLWGNDEVGFRNEDFESIWPLLWDRMVRNKVGNAKYVIGRLFADEQDFIQVDNLVATDFIGDPMEEEGFKWRWRRLGVFSSFRVTWGPARADKGKREFYIGFQLGSNVPGVGFTFFQFRAL